MKIEMYKKLNSFKLEWEVVHPTETDLPFNLQEET